ncbi:uncharacterized protein LOC111553783 isoform X1 [Piliocolobus tephrosceles]|uniref:Uncharacterized LOC111553783 n=1 Tax=Piliocolobus tephrosceles TaxID=591936 RepID=A0A8C9LZY8_9PRIM|nr:uncharacterized protein LOC111553783 isoform X1 [Piliocolobus tephrosceles]
MEGKQVSPGGNPGLRFAQRSPCECVEHLLCAGGTEAHPGSHVHRAERDLRGTAGGQPGNGPPLVQRQSPRMPDLAPRGSLGSSFLAVGTGRLLRVRVAPPPSPLSGVGIGGTEPGQGGRQGPAHPTAQPRRVRRAGLAGAGHSTPSPVEGKEQKQGTESCRLLCNNSPRSLAPSDKCSSAVSVGQTSGPGEGASASRSLARPVRTPRTVSGLQAPGGEVPRLCWPRGCGQDSVLHGRLE